LQLTDGVFARRVLWRASCTRWVRAVVWATNNRAEIYVREAMATLFVKSPLRYGAVVTFETVANVQDVYKVRALRIFVN